MEKKWNAIQYCVILALALTSTNCLCQFGQGYFTGKEVLIIKRLGGNSPTLEVVASNRYADLERIEEDHYAEGRYNAFVSVLLIYALVSIRKNEKLGPILPSTPTTT